MKKLTVVGSFVTDMVATLDIFPAEGESIIGKKLRIYLGGKGANQCVAIKRLGGNVEMIGMLGSDVNGDNFRQLLKDEGIKCDNVFVTDDEPTAVAQVQINSASQNKICVIPGANYCFGVEHLQRVEEVIKNSDIVIAQLELSYEVTIELIKMCDRFKVKLILNPAPAVKLPMDILKLIHIITPNESELALLTDMPVDTEVNVLKAAKKLYRLGIKCIIATLGERGAFIYDERGGRIVKGYKVKAVDTVAAGDSFNGAVAVALSEGKSTDDAVMLANAMGALTVQVSGAIPSLHKREQVEEFMNKNPSQTIIKIGE